MNDEQFRSTCNRMTAQFNDMLPKGASLYAFIENGESYWEVDYDEEPSVFASLCVNYNGWCYADNKDFPGTWTIRTDWSEPTTIENKYISALAAILVTLSLMLEVAMREFDVSRETS